MLVEFSVENFRSIKKEQTISLLATKSKEHPENLIAYSDSSKFNILRSAVIYGANASGKTNILKALENLVYFILFSTDLKLEQKIPSYKPHKLDNAYHDQPTKFQIEFIGPSNVRYRYLIHFTANEVIREELLFYPKKQEAILFSREKGKKIKFGNYLTGRKKNIEAELLPNNLFLSKAANSNLEHLQKIYIYFLETFVFKMKDELRFTGVETTRKMTDTTDSSFSDKVSLFLKSVDTGISSLKVVKTEFKDDAFFDSFPKDMPKHIVDDIRTQISLRPMTSHRLYDNDNEVGMIDFDIAEESDGTNKLYSLSSDIITALLNGSVYVIDEIDNSLHPHITEFIIKLFNNPRINKKNAQLITATHDSSLLNPNLVRRDQIWFTNKVKNGSTELYSLVEFNKDEVRAKTPYNDWYLSGRFSAVPVIDKNVYSIFEDCDSVQ